jgi:dephospho-CoA kinase
MLVGITGKMGSGKSTVAGLFEAWGARVISADETGWAVLQRPEVKGALVSEFGDEILGSGGEIDRKALGRKAFRSRQCLEALNGIVHPTLLAVLRQNMDASANEGGMVAVDAALIPEWGIEGWFDTLVVVICPEDLKLERLASMGMERKEAEARLASQISDEDRAELGDYVIENSGTLEELSMKARHVFDSVARSGAVYRTGE